MIPCTKHIAAISSWWDTEEPQDAQALSLAFLFLNYLYKVRISGPRKSSNQEQERYEGRKKLSSLLWVCRFVQGEWRSAQCKLHCSGTHHQLSGRKLSPFISSVISILSCRKQKIGWWAIWHQSLKNCVWLGHPSQVMHQKNFHMGQIWVYSWLTVNCHVNSPAICRPASFQGGPSS